MMNHEEALERKPSEKEIIQYIMETEELPLTETEIAGIIEKFFQEADNCASDSNRITQIHWKNSRFLGGWRIFCYEGQRTRMLSYENEGEEKLMFLLEILSKVNQDTLKNLLEKDGMLEGYTVTVKDDFRGITRL